MTKLFTGILVLLATNVVLASGYGGYDYEQVEVGTIEIELKGQLRATCEESNKTIVDMVNINNCDDKWTIAENCECLDDSNGYSVCEMTRTVGCDAYWEYY